MICKVLPNTHNHTIQAISQASKKEINFDLQLLIFLRSTVPFCYIFFWVRTFVVHRAKWQRNLKFKWLRIISLKNWQHESNPTLQQYLNVWMWIGVSVSVLKSSLNALLLHPNQTIALIAYAKDASNQSKRPTPSMSFWVPTHEPLRRAIFGSASSIFNLWSDLEESLDCWVSVEFLYTPPFLGRIG